MSATLLLQLWCFLPFSKIFQMLVESCVILNKNSTKSQLVEKKEIYQLS